ncbi:unnamed protein product, partial [Amoebophrya sp. A25]
PTKGLLGGPDSKATIPNDVYESKARLKQLIKEGSFEFLRKIRMERSDLSSLRGTLMFEMAKLPYKEEKIAAFKKMLACM